MVEGGGVLVGINKIKGLKSFRSSTLTPTYGHKLQFII